MGYFDLKKQLSSTPTTKGGGYFALKERVNPIIEANRRREEEERIAEERRRKIQEVSDYATQKQQEARDLVSPWGITKEAGKGIWSGVKGFGKEMGKAVVRSAAMGADIVNRMSPVETLRGLKSGIETIGDRQGTETRTQAFKRGVADFQARPLIYEKAEAKLEGKPGYRLPKMEKPSDILSPEYRKPIMAAAEIPTYAYGARPIATAGKGLLARIMARTASTQPEALIEAGLQTAGEEKPTLKSAAMNYLAATLLMSGISNTVGEIKFKKTDKVVDETVNEIEDIFGEKLPEEGVDDITEAFNQGVKKETIIENASKVAPEVTETIREPRTLKPGELARETKAVEEATGKLDINQKVEVRNKLEKGFTPEEIADDIMARKVEAKPKATITDDITKAKAEGKSFDEFLYGKNKDGKVEVRSVLDLLETGIKKEDLDFVRIARETVDNSNQDADTIQKAIKAVRDEGYEDYARYLDFLERGNFDFNMSQKTKSQLKKLWEGAKVESKPELKPKPVKTTIPKKESEYKIIKKSGIEKVDGEPVEIVDGVETFLHKDENGNWAVSEVTTGRNISDGGFENKTFAVKRAKENLDYQIDSIGIKKFKEVISNNKLQVETPKKASKVTVKPKPKTTITDDIAKAKAEGKSFEEFFEENTKLKYQGAKTRSLNTPIRETGLRANELSKKRLNEMLANSKINRTYNKSYEMAIKKLKEGGETIEIYRALPKGESINFRDFVALTKEEASKYLRKSTFSDELLDNYEVVKKTVNKNDLVQQGRQSVDFGYIPKNYKSQLKQLWEGTKVETKLKPKTKPKAAKSTVKKSKLAGRMNEDLPDDYKMDEFYDSTTIKKELNQASEDIAKNKDKAMIEAFSRDTKATQRVAKLTELAEIAKKNGDFEAQNAILSRMRREGTEAGQEINMFKAYNFMNPETEFMKHVVNARLKKLSVGISDVTKAKKVAMEKLARVADDIKKTTKNFKVKDAQDLFNKLICK